MAALLFRPGRVALADMFHTAHLYDHHQPFVTTFQNSAGGYMFSLLYLVLQTYGKEGSCRLDVGR